VCLSQPWPGVQYLAAWEPTREFGERISGIDGRSASAYDAGVEPRFSGVLTQDSNAQQSASGSATSALRQQIAGADGRKGSGEEQCAVDCSND
jgi:hypothetical protein